MELLNQNICCLFDDGRVVLNFHLCAAGDEIMLEHYGRRMRNTHEVNEIISFQFVYAPFSYKILIVCKKEKKTVSHQSSLRHLLDPMLSDTRQRHAKKGRRDISLIIICSSANDHDRSQGRRSPR